MTSAVALEPAWAHYANDPLALASIIFCHQREMHHDPANAEWYQREIADITAHLRGRA